MTIIQITFLIDLVFPPFDPDNILTGDGDDACDSSLTFPKPQAGRKRTFCPGGGD